MIKIVFNSAMLLLEVIILLGIAFITFIEFGWSYNYYVVGLGCMSVIIWRFFNLIDNKNGTTRTL